MSSAAADEPDREFAVPAGMERMRARTALSNNSARVADDSKKEAATEKKESDDKEKTDEKAESRSEEASRQRQKKHEDSRKTATIKHSNAKRAAAPTRVQLLFFSVSWQLFFSHIDKGQSRRLRHFLNRSITHFFVEPDIGPAFRTSI